MDLLADYWWFTVMCIGVTAYAVHRYRRARSPTAAERVTLLSRPSVIVPLMQPPDVVLRELRAAIAPTSTLTDQVLGVATADRIHLIRCLPRSASRSDSLAFDGRIADDGRAIVGHFRLSGWTWFSVLAVCVFALITPLPLSWTLRAVFIVIGTVLVPAVAWRLGSADRRMILGLLRRVARTSDDPAA